MSVKSIHEALAEMQRKINEQRMKNAEANWNSIEEKTNAEIQQGVNDTVKQNNIKNPNLIYPGQKIKLPNGTDYTVQKGDNLWNINKMRNNPGASSGPRPSEVPDSTPAPQNKSPDGYQDKLKEPAPAPEPKQEPAPAPTVNRYNGPIKNDEFRNRGVGATDATGGTNITGPRGQIGQGMDSTSSETKPAEPVTATTYPQPDVKVASAQAAQTMKQMPTGPKPPSAQITVAGANEDGGPTKKKAKMSESALINAVLGLDLNSSNIFEAAKKAKKDWDHDGKIESEKDEVWGSRFRAARKAKHMNEAVTHKVGDHVEIDAPGFASHGHKGIITKILPDGRPEVDFGGFRTGTQSRITTTMGGAKTIVEPSALRKINYEEVETIDELSAQTYYNAADKANRKAEELRNTDTFTGHSAAAEYQRQANKFKEKAVRSELPKSKQRKINYEEVETIEEKLIGNQTKLDKNKNGRLDKKDFELLGKKKMMEGKCPECGMNPCKCGPHVKEEIEVSEGKRGLWDNIHAKQERIKRGSGEHMRKPGSKGAPTSAALKNSQNEEAESVDEAGPFAKKVLAGSMKGYHDSRKGQAPIDSWEKNAPAKRTAEVEKRSASLKKVKVPGVQMEGLFSDEELEHLASFDESAVAPQTDKDSADVGQVPSSAILDESGKKKMGRPSKADKDAENPNAGMGRDPRQHIQVQAGRAMAGVPVDFKHDNGDVSKLTAPMGRKIISHLADLKPADRQSAVAKMHASAEGLKV